MGYKEGANLVLNFKYPFQHFNRIKNHFAISNPIVALSDAVAGMIVHDSDDDKLYHFTGQSPGHDEILQENFSSDAEPVFNALRLGVTSSDVSDPPTAAELIALFGQPWHVGAGWFAFLWDGISASDKYYLVGSDGINWRYMTLTAAV